MIALWEKPHHLLVKSEANSLTGDTIEFRAQTSKNGCRCSDLVRAITARGVDLEVRTGDFVKRQEHGVLHKISAELKVAELPIEFCPFCGKSAKLLMPRTEWKSKSEEKTR